MSQVEQFDVLIFGSGREARLPPGPAAVKDCGQRWWSAA